MDDPYEELEREEGVTSVERGKWSGVSNIEAEKHLGKNAREKYAQFLWAKHDETHDAVEYVLKPKLTTLCSG